MTRLGGVLELNREWSTSARSPARAGALRRELASAPGRSRLAAGASGDPYRSRPDRAGAGQPARQCGEVLRQGRSIGLSAGSSGCRRPGRDDGPGIPVEAREAVFEEFHRGTRRPATAGTGLGLAVCRGIIEALGGKIIAATGPTGQARYFTIAFPRRRGEDAGLTRARGMSSATGIRLLVVDDEPPIRRLCGPASARRASRSSKPDSGEAAPGSRPQRPTWSSSTWACPTSTAWR